MIETNTNFSIDSSFLDGNSSKASLKTNFDFPLRFKSPLKFDESENELVHNYLRELWNSKELESSDREVVTELLSKIHKKLIVHIRRGFQPIEEQKKTILLKREDPKIFEENKKKNMIAEASKMKKELLEKLKSIEERIKELGLQETMQETRKKGMTSNNSFSSAQSKESEEFMKKIRHERALLEKLKKKRMEEILEKERLNLEQMEQKKKEEEEENQRKREKIAVSIERIRHRVQAREENNKENEEAIKELLKKNPLERFENNFNAGYLMPELVKKKKALADLRELHKPLLKKDLEDHDRKYMEFVRQREEAKKLEKDKDKQKPGYKPSYEGHFYKEVEEEKLKSKLAENERKSRLDELNQRKKEFEKKLKEQYMPEIDRAKEIELKKLIADQEVAKYPKKRLKLKHGDSSSEKFEEYEVIQPQTSPKTQGKEYLSYVRSLPKKKFQDSTNETTPEETSFVKEASQGAKSVATGEKLNDSFEKKQDPKKTKPPLPKHNDYLKQLRDKNILKHEPLSAEFEKIIKNKNLTEIEKIDLVKQKALLLEEKARRREDLAKLRSQNNTSLNMALYGADDDPDDLYLEAIKAKLSILNEV